MIKIYSQTQRKFVEEEFEKNSSDEGDLDKEEVESSAKSCFIFKRQICIVVHKTGKHSRRSVSAACYNGTHRYNKICCKMN